MNDAKVTLFFLVGMRLVNNLEVASAVLGQLETE